MTTALMAQPRPIQIGGGEPVRRRRNRDNVPEKTFYRDDGCDIHPQCLSCPLPRCRYEEPGGLRGVLNRQRDDHILRLRARGLSVPELALRFNVSRRTVFRVLGSENARRRINRGLEPIPLRPLVATQAPAPRREASCA